MVWEFFMGLFAIGFLLAVVTFAGAGAAVGALIGIGLCLWYFAKRYA